MNVVILKCKNNKKYS